MKKYIWLAFIIFSYCNNISAEEYYFKKCKLNENTLGDYLIDIKKNEINVILSTTEGQSQKYTDKIKLVEKDKIYSEIITNKINENFFTQYYLDVNSRSVIRQGYLKSESGIVKPKGKKKQGYCEIVKSGWSEKLNKENNEIKKEKKNEKKKKKKKKKKLYKILIESEDWVDLSKFNPASNEKLKDDFDKKATEICISKGKKFKIVEKNVKIIEMDETPAFGLEPKVRVGIVGIIDCI